MALSAAASAAALCALATPALAAPAQFGTEGEGAGQFRVPTGIALNQESADVYLADRENNRVEEFSSEGSFLRAWGFGVSDGESEEFQICQAPGPCFAGIGGTAGGQLSQPTGVAVDNSAGLSHGDVYVEDPANHRIERFGANGELILTFGGEVNKTAQEKGETANEDVCPVNPGDQCQAGTPGPGPSRFESLGRNAIAIGPTGTVYVGDIERVQKFSAAGVPEGEIKLPGVGTVQLLAVDSSSEIYVYSTELTGIRKYDGVGIEQPTVRDAGLSGGLNEPAITVGAGDELLISDPVSAPAGHILEYDAAGAQSGSFLEQNDGFGGMALNQSAKTIYTIHLPPARVVIQALPPEGPVVLEGSESASEVLPTSAVLNATINPEGSEASEYHFEYGTSEAYGASTPETPLKGGESEFEDQPVSAAISGLEPSTLYHFRVVVENAAKQVTFGPDQTFQTLPPVSIDSESASAVTASSAKLLAELNPHGLPSEYHFEYGLSSVYEHSAPVPDAEAGEGSTDETFAVTIQQLQPHTLYHYRVIAHNTLGVVQGADQTFTTQGGKATGLPDGRAYEMVSPADKHGVSLEAMTETGSVIEAAKDGGALTYFALGPIDQEPAGSRSNKNSQILARRARAGAWSTEDITTPHQAPAGVEVGKPSEYKLFSDDLARGALEPVGATALSPQASERTPYLREADGSYTPLVYPGNVPPGTKFGGVEEDPEGFEDGVQFVTGTPDLRHVLLSSPSSLVQGFETGGERSIYEWSEGVLTAVSILPGGAPASEERLAQVGNGDFQVRGAIAYDGRRAFFTTTLRQRLYMRDIVRGETLRADAAEAGMKAAEGGARFQMANRDGSKVLFTDANKLTKDSTATQQAPDLYECEVVLEGEELACKLSDLSVDSHAGEAADVHGAVIGASEDGRYVYFVAKGALAEGAASGPCTQPGEGKCVNLYVYDTVASSKRLVAVLSEGDSPDWTGGGNGQDLGEVTSRVSPDGQYVAFMSRRRLTGYDNRDANSGQQDEEVFIYDYARDELRCASCDASGQRPVGVLDESVPGPLIDRANVWSGHWLAASIPGWTRVDLGHALHQPRYLSNGGRLFFNTPQSLVGADGNGTQDVYEFEPEGVGSCDRATGCVSLISAGSSSEETALLDAGESGDDVFFITAAQLSLTDEDKAFDIYGAHVCADPPGCPAPAVGAPPPCSSSDACRAAPAPQPGIFGAPASSTFSGAGNLMPPTGKASPRAKPPTRAQLLAKALKACKKKRPAKGRARCIKKAKAKYASRHAGKAKKSAGKKSAAKNASARGKS